MEHCLVQVDAAKGHDDFGDLAPVIRRYRLQKVMSVTERAQQAQRGGTELNLVI